MKRFILSIVIIFSILGLTTAMASAYSPLGGVDCSGKASNSAVCQDRGKTSDPVTGGNGAILKAAHIIGIIAGIAAVIMMIVAGIKYATSGGDPQATSSAKSTIIYALVGIIVIAFAEVIITFVVSRV